MNGEELKKLRTHAGMTQARAAEALGISANYLAMMERGEKPIETRTAQLIEALLMTRIDVSYSEALGKWVVAIIKPAASFAGREHHLIAAKDSLADAQKVAHAEWDRTGKLAMFITRQPDRRPNQ